MFWDTLRSDLQHAVRLAAKSPLITALTIVALALGIGANSAIFAVVDSVLVKSLPYADADRLVHLWSDATKQGRPRNTLSPANFQDFQRMNKTLDGLEAYLSFVTPFKLTGDDGNSEIVVGVTVTPRLFDLLGRKPILGRPISDDDSQFETLSATASGSDDSAAIRTSSGARCKWGHHDHRRRRHAAGIHVSLRIDARPVRIHPGNHNG